MYQRILVAIENSAADRTILDHVSRAGEADRRRAAAGPRRRRLRGAPLRRSQAARVRGDEGGSRVSRDAAAELRGRGLTVDIELAKGDPADELIRVAEARQVDLIAMSTHGHRFLADLLKGTTASKVRHLVRVPVLLLRAQ